MRLAATRNLLKVWGFVLVLCAGLGLLGWSAGGYPLLSSVVFCSLLATAAAYWYADRVVMGMVGARELALAEAPLVHSTLERLAARANVAKPKLYVHPRRPPSRVRRGPRAARLGDRRLARAPRRGPARGARRRARARARARASTATSSRRKAWSSSPRRSSRRLGSAAPCSVSCSSCSGRSPRRPSTSCSRPSGSSPRTGLRPSSASPRTASPTRCCAWSWR